MKLFNWLERIQRHFSLTQYDDPGMDTRHAVPRPQWFFSFGRQPVYVPKQHPQQAPPRRRRGRRRSI